MKDKNNKFDFKKKKNLTLNSLNQVNYFLLNINKSIKSVKLFKWIKNK